jgi:hypothetical protein
MASRAFATALLLCIVGNAAAMEDRTNLNVNPIRKVVVMLQNMQKKIAAESVKKEKMYDQYMCYCENADGTLGKSISDAETKIPQLESSISEGAALKKQLEAEFSCDRERHGRCIFADQRSICASSDLRVCGHGSCRP